MLHSFYTHFSRATSSESSSSVLLLFINNLNRSARLDSPHQWWSGRVKFINSPPFHYRCCLCCRNCGVSFLFFTFRLFTPNWYLGRVTACAGCATTSYTRPYFFLFQRQHLSVSGRCVCVHTYRPTHTRWQSAGHIFLSSWLLLGFFIFSNAAPQAKGWLWIMGPVEPIGAMRRADGFAFINWQHELNIGLLLLVSDPSRVDQVVWDGLLRQSFFY